MVILRYRYNKLGLKNAIDLAMMLSMNGVLTLGLFMATMQPPTVVANVVKYLRFIGKTPLDENKLELEGVIDLDPTTECILRKTPIDFRASRPDY